MACCVNAAIDRTNRPAAGATAALPPSTATLSNARRATSRRLAPVASTALGRTATLVTRLRWIERDAGRRRRIVDPAVDAHQLALDRLAFVDAGREESDRLPGVGIGEGPRRGL